MSMLTKEPAMLQLDAFCVQTMQQNETAAGARTPLGELTVFPYSPRHLAGFKGASSRWREGREWREGEGRGEDRKGRRGQGGRGRGREVDSDGQLEQGLFF